MSVAKQLYQLQEIDLQFESEERALNQVLSQLGESEIVNQTRDRLKAEQLRLEELQKQQQAAEWEIDDLTFKLSQVDEKLYGGQITSPKELTNLQHEAEELKARRSQLEDRVLEVMDEIEQVTASIANTSNELKTLESEWHSQQQKLSKAAGQLKTALSSLREKRQLLSVRIDPGVIELYDELRKHKGTAVAEVRQGICGGCRISLPVTELQRARTGSLVRCSSCSRILYLA